MNNQINVGYNEVSRIFYNAIHHFSIDKTNITNKQNIKFK